MNRMLKVASILLLLIAVQSVKGQTESDSCHVYAVDVLTAQKAFERFQPSGDDAKDRKALEAGTMIVDSPTSF